MHGPGHSYPAFPGMRYEVGKILGYEVWRRINKLMFPLNTYSGYSAVIS